jgi:inner membrane transporter RhtA
MPSTAYVIGAIASVQLGSSFAKTIFDEVGAGGTVFLRVALSAVVLALLWRPRVQAHAREDLWLAAAFGLCLAGMNTSFYLALDRIPLGIAVTFEFIGPLGVAVLGSRRRLDLLWVALAAAGILLLAGFGGARLDGLGVALALGAGVLWGSYILISARVGRAFPGGDGLAIAMIVATAVLVPVGVADGGADLLTLHVLGVGLAVAMLSSAIPYSLELEALRRMPANVFGVLMSLEPAAAALAGFVVLGEDLIAREIAAIALVVVASAGAARTAPPELEPLDA